MAVPTALLILLLTIPSAYGTQYTVGDSSGWDQGVDYTTWAAGKTFNIGDTLSFSYTPNHGVDEVNESDYGSCSSSNAIATHSGGSTTITLSKAGKWFFICPTGGHCASGMKLAVDVVAASTTPSTPASPPGSPPTTPSAGTPPTTPSTTTSSPPPPPSGNGAASVFLNMMLGSLLVLGSTLALIG